MAQVGITPSKAIFGAYSLLVAWSVYAVGFIWRALANRPRSVGALDWIENETARREIRSIALIRLDEMGDFALFSSILRPLRQAFPGARITLVLCDWICPLAELCPYVDKVIPFPSSGPKWWQFMLGPFRALRIALQFDRHFDLVINPRFDRDIRGAAFLAHFSGASWVLGFPSSTEPFKALANRGYDRFYTHLLPAPVKVLHELERSRTILDFLGIRTDSSQPELWLSAEDRRQASRLLRQYGWRPGETIICLGINASLARRRWPIHCFVQLAGRLMSLADVRFLVVGSKRDRDNARLLQSALGSRVINLAGRSALRVSAAALAECDLYVGNDSGPMHLAAALAKPVVEISCHPEDGDTAHFQAPQRFGAMAQPAVVLAPAKALAPCRITCLATEPHCITQISVDEVFDAVVAVVHTRARKQVGT